MKLSWAITKKVGNWRPVLKYSYVYERWEVDLRPATGSTSIVLPTAPTWHGYRTGSTDEVANYSTAEPCGKPRVMHFDDNPECTYEVMLPWRPGGPPAYPEVEAAMAAFLAEWECRVLAALESGPLNEAGEIEHSIEFKRQVAPYVAAWRMRQK